MDAVLSSDGYLFHTKKGKPVEVPVPLAPLADTHGHLTSFRTLEAPAAVARAALAGVRLLVVPVDPSDDVSDAAEFLRWFAQVRDKAARLLAACADRGAVPPAFAGWGAAAGEASDGTAQHPVATAANCAGTEPGASSDPTRTVATHAVTPRSSNEPCELGRNDARPANETPCRVLGPSLTDNLFFVAGVHPYGAQRYVDDPAVEARLRRLLEDPRCVGVGEFGLDYGPWNEVSSEAQEEAFRRQLRLAHEYRLPVELHLRDANDDEHALAHEDALRVLTEEGVPAAGCDLHCFTCGPEVLAPFAELGCRIAFGGAATFARSDDIRAAAAACPADLLLSETDCPYMAPVPLRGQECEPAMVAFSAAKVAEVRAEAGLATPEQTYAQLWRNACAFFGLVG